MGRRVGEGRRRYSVVWFVRVFSRRYSCSCLVCFPLFYAGEFSLPLRSIWVVCRVSERRGEDEKDDSAFYPFPGGRKKHY